jgi:hypothetical protein
MLPPGRADSTQPSLTSLISRADGAVGGSISASRAADIWASDSGDSSRLYDPGNRRVSATRVRWSNVHWRRFKKAPAQAGRAK